MGGRGRRLRQAVTLAMAPVAVVVATFVVVLRLGADAQANSQGPTVTIVSPTEAARLPLGTVEVVTRVEDPDGVADVQLEVDDHYVARATVASLPVATVTFLWNAEEPRRHHITVLAHDVRGSSGEVAAAQLLRRLRRSR